ncbi:hypothetical protein [Aquipuribacter hungaricus]|uniref:Uncharacterized protein n=1 Tax=Aquipuribacter hungaricus TaxID=545624 RepID=A0ABV7WFI5_9MICO
MGVLVGGTLGQQAGVRVADIVQVLQVVVVVLVVVRRDEGGGGGRHGTRAGRRAAEGPPAAALRGHRERHHRDGGWPWRGVAVVRRGAHAQWCRQRHRAP